MKTYKMMTDERTIGLLDKGFCLTAERADACYRRLRELELMLQSGELKFVSKKETKKESRDEK